MKVELWVWPEGERLRAAPLEDLAKISVPANIEEEDGTTKATQTLLDTEEKLLQMFPGGRVECATFREKMNGRDNETAAAYQWVDGVYHPERYGKGWALTLLESWTFVDEKARPLPANETGYYQLDPEIQDVLNGSVGAWKQAVAFPNSTRPLTIKSGPSKPSEAS